MEEDPSFKVTMKLHEQKIYRAISQYVSDACTIQDLVQITFLKAYVARETFKGESSYSTWLYRIAVNTALNFIKSQKTNAARSCFDPKLVEKIPDAYTVESTAITNEEMQIVYKSIEQLTSDLKKTLVLHVIYGLSYEDIAETLDIPIGTVRSRINRARYELRRLIANYH